MHRIKKTFECDYGHRVHNQSLNQEYSIDDCLVCRHLHGHRMSVDVWLEAAKLTNDMVTDFKHLNWFKQFIDDVVDHKFIIDIDDPLFQNITGHMPLEVKYREHYGTTYGYFELDPETPLLNELTESFVIVNFVPTSENLSKWLFKVVQRKMIDLGVVTKAVHFRETPKSEAIYEV